MKSKETFTAVPKSVTPIQAHKTVVLDESEKEMEAEEDKKTVSSSHHTSGTRNVSNNGNTHQQKQEDNAIEVNNRMERLYFPEHELGDRYRFVRYLGRGAYGHVAEGVAVKKAQRQDGTTTTTTTTTERTLEEVQHVAIKKMTNIFDHMMDAKRILREIRILRMLQNHPCIVKVMDVLPTGHPRPGQHCEKVIETNEDKVRWHNWKNDYRSIIVVFEFVDTDLQKLIESNQYFLAVHVQYIMYQVFSAVAYMHSNHVYHRDLKPANILVSENCTVKICDFGLARCIAPCQERAFAHDLMASAEDVRHAVSATAVAASIPHKQTRNALHFTQHIVTCHYRSPEVILMEQKLPFLYGIDMWSIGCIFAELLQMLKENCRQFEQRKPLFSSYRGNDTFTLSDRISQLDVIFRVIGTPSPEEIESSMILNENNKKYLRNLSPKFEPINWKSKFPDTDNEDALSLLNALLQFDCEKRMTAREALQHSYFPTEIKESIDWKAVHESNKKERKVRSHIYKSLQELESNWGQNANTEANYRNRIADEILLFS